MVTTTHSLEAEIPIFKLLKIFKIFEGGQKPNRINLKLTLSDSAEDDSLDFTFQTSSSQISFSLQKLIANSWKSSISDHDEILEFSLNLAALKNALGLLDPTAGQNTWHAKGKIDSYFARKIVDMCKIGIVYEGNNLGLDSSESDQEEHDFRSAALILSLCSIQDHLASTCKLSLCVPDPLQSFDDAFDMEPIVAGFIIKSDLLINAFSSLDETCTLIEICVTPLHHVVFKANGLAGESEITFSSKSISFPSLPSDTMDTDHSATSFCYQFERVKELFKTFGTATQTRFQFNSHGIMHLQSTIDLDLSTTPSQHIYINAIILPLVDDEE